jgi:CMP-N-acetylneuraminic acid synthetase
VILSTDDEEIAAVGGRLGLDAPFLRPAELARDDTPTLAVLQHAIRWLAGRGERYDAVALLQPTSPLRPAGLVDRAVRLLVEQRATSVVTVRPVPHQYNPHWVFVPSGDGSIRLATGEAQPIPRRQSLPPAYIRDGMLYLTLTRVLMEEDSLYGSRCVPLYQAEEDAINLDSPLDFERAEAMLQIRGSGAGSAACSV